VSIGQHPCLCHEVEHSRSLIKNQGLAGEGLWSRVDVAGWDRVVDVDQDTGVGGLVSSRESNKVLRRRAATSGNLNLST
jgi:hypothetical protein